MKSKISLLLVFLVFLIADSNQDVKIVNPVLQSHNAITQEDLVLEFPATCFAPDADPKIVERHYNRLNDRANSLGLSPENLINRFNVLNRWSSTALSGGGLAQGDFTTLTWSYVPDGTPIGNGGCGVGGESTDPSDFISFFNTIYGPPATPGDFTTAPWHSLFIDMFNSWSAVSGLNFVYEPNDDGVTVVTGGGGASGIRGDLRISGHPLDGNSGVLACNYFPNNGDMIIDTSDNFYSNNPALGTLNVLTHEIGHGLGILHVCPVEQTKLMEPFVTTAFQGPQEDDILATNRNYGDPEGTNDTPASATFLGANANPTSYTKLQRSIDDNDDIDYFSFTISELSTLTLSLTPTGTTYLDGTQNNNGSCSSGTNFNALTVSDLMVEVLDSDGSSLLATADANGAGIAENLITSISAAGTYFVRVQQQGPAVDNVQMYNLDLSLEAGECTTALIPTNLQASSITDTSAELSWDTQNNVSFDLRYRESGTSTWTIILDLTASSTTLTGLSGLTEYEVQVRSKCPDDTPTAYSPSIFFTTLENIIVPYCDAGATNPNLTNIFRVIFNTIDNTSPSPNTGYSDFTAISTSIVEGETNTLSVLEEGNTVYFDDKIIVWIDFNKDGVFDNSVTSDEKVLETSPFQNGDSYPLGGNITIPNGVSFGETRMRIRIYNAGFGPNDTPCGDSAIGEVEDYTVNVIPDGFFFQNGAWTPTDPSSVSTAVDNVTVINGSPILTGDVIANNLVIETGASLSTVHTLNINGSIENDGNLIFSSDNTGSGQLDTFTGTITGTGNVTTERYIAAGPPDERRAYRLLTSGVNSSGSINANWQEGATTEDITPNPNPGFGTHITGGDATLGFDQNETGNPSMFTFNNDLESIGTEAQPNAWQALPDTNSKTLLAGEAYLTFIRGDRSIDVTSNSSTPTNTTLRATGELYTGTRIFSSDNNTNDPDDPPPYGLSDVSNYFSLVGNPYQAIVDINNLDFNNINPNAYWVWDPYLGTRGNYATVSLPGGFNTSSSPANKYIQPGQSFFVQTIADGTASLTFNEDDKSVSGIATTIFSEQNNSSIKILLYTNTALNAGERETDGLLINFNESSNNDLDQFDADKLQGPDESLARLHGNELISIENRALPEHGENLPIYLKGYVSNNYSFVVNANNIQANFEAYLIDGYTNNHTLLNEGLTQINFSVDSNIPASIAEDRFSLSFNNTTLGIDGNNFGADFNLYPNPTKDGLFKIKTQGLNGKDVKVKLYNVAGQQLMRKVLNVNSNGEVHVNGSDLSPGVYIVRLEHKQQEFVDKLIVE